MDWAALVSDSYRRVTGADLPPAQPALAHDGSSDPLITWVNAAAALLWQRSPHRFVGIPSRWTALPGDRAERAHALSADGVSRGYAGLRVSAVGRRFRIEDATIWPVTEPDGRMVGQAATFPNWQPVSRILIEALCTSMAEVTDALAVGADRIELCVAPEIGGVTPPEGLIREAVPLAAESGVGVMVMIRPRGGDFVYSPSEYDEMRTSMTRATAAGAAGVVFGCLTPDRVVNREQTAALAALADGPATFHRAIDETVDPVAAAEVVSSLGCDRILSSGGAATASDGIATIAAMVEASSATVMAGSGVTPDVVHQVVAQTGVTEVHGSFRADGASLVPAVRAALPSTA